MILIIVCLSYYQQKENPYASELPSRKDHLPQDRRANYDDIYHVGTSSSEGYLTAQQVLEIFDKRGENPNEWTVENVAQQYKIDSRDAENLLKNFNNYRVVKSAKKPDDPLGYHPLHR